MRRIEMKDTEQLIFDGLPGRPMTAYRWPPPGGPSGHMNNVLQSAVRKMEALDAASGQAAANKLLSPAGRAEHVAPPRSVAAAAIVDGLKRVQAEQRRIDAARSILFAVPVLDPGDAAGALLDREIRERINSLGEHERDRLWAEMKNGGQPRVLAALLRDPFPSTIQQSARGVWETIIAKTNKVEVARLDADEGAAEWAASALGGLQTVLDRSDGYGRRVA